MRGVKIDEEGVLDVVSQLLAAAMAWDERRSDIVIEGLGPLASAGDAHSQSWQTEFELGSDGLDEVTADIKQKLANFRQFDASGGGIRPFAVE